MSDKGVLTSGGPKYEAWCEQAQPLMEQGKGKEAMRSYPWFTTEGEPFVRLGKPLSQACVGLLTTGGYSIQGQHEPFTGKPDFSAIAPEVRLVPLDADRSKLRIDHRGYDHRFAEEDYNANLPLDRLREMVDNGEIGSIANDTLAMMGLITNLKPLIEETIPQIVDRFRSDGVEAALLVPS